MKYPLILISVIAVAAVVLIAAVYGLGILGTNSPSATITGVSPPNQSVIPDNRPTLWMNLTVHNVNIDSLNFTLFIDDENATGGLIKGPYGVQFALPNELAEGAHDARANVSLGQTILASLSWRFSVDTSPPELYGLSPANGTTHSGEGLVASANFTDQTGIDLDRLKLLLDGGDITSISQRFQNGISYSPSTPLNEGTHNLTMELYDLIGNKASYSWFLTIKYPVEDSFPPYLIAYSPTNNSLVGTSYPLVWFHINDTISGVDIGSATLKIDNIPVSFIYSGSHSSGWNISYSGHLTDNNHTAWINVQDYNNNSRSEQIRFTVDSTPPNVGAITPSNGSALSSSSVIISARFMDIIAGVDPSSVVLIVDSFYNPANAVINSSGFSYSTLLLNGTHSVSIRVSDLAGNLARVNWAFSVNLPSNNNTEPSDDVIILTKTGYFNTESGLPTIVGEVKNTGTTTVKNVLVQGLFLCKDGKVINNDGPNPAIVYGYAEIEILEPGDVSPFKIVMPSDFPAFDYILTQLAKFNAIIEDYTVTTQVPYKDYQFSNVTISILPPDNHYNLTGVITNTGSTALSDIKIVGTFYTADKPIAVESMHVYSLDPGEQAYFTIMVEDNDVAPLITRYNLKGSP